MEETTGTFERWKLYEQNISSSLWLNSYAMKDFLSAKFSMMLEVSKSDDWCRAYVCCKRVGEERLKQEKRG